MTFCPKCGNKLATGTTFCSKCGAQTKNNEEPEKVKEESTPEPTKKSTGGSKAGWACGACSITFVVVVILAVIFGFFALAFIGAKGQPGTVMKPTETKTPQNLTATEGDKAINLSWQKSGSSNVNKYNVYKSIKDAKDYQKISTIETADLQYQDKQAKQGITYYYVVTALTSDGKESGNTNQVSFALTPLPLIPQGVNSWNDVLTKYNADSKYADVLTKVTKLTKADIEKYTGMENKGKKLKTTLKKETIITNTTENYKIIPNFVLTKNKEFLTDDKGVPHIMVWCGNPIKLIKNVTWISEIAQSIQKITYNIIYIFPVPVTNIFIYAGQPLNTFVVGIMPNTFGPTVMNPESINIPNEYPTDQILVDTAQDLGTSNKSLEEGQKWAVEGKILLEANPHDPQPGESVKMTAQIFPAESGVDVEYSVSGTDGYSASGTLKTNAEGKIEFNIPGGGSGIVDTINVNMPSRSVNGSTSYTF